MGLFSVDPMQYLDEDASRLVGTYFRAEGGVQFTGRMFERLAGGGDHPSRCDVFDATDLVAVTMLSVSVPAEAAIWILGDGADQLSALLRDIPADVALG